MTGVMSKYGPLAIFLRRQKTEAVTLTFADIERIVGRLLPKASKASEWWQADAASTQPQKRLFAEAGIVAVPNVRGESVVFWRHLKTCGDVGDDPARAPP